MVETVSGLLDVIQDMPETSHPPPPPGGSTDIGAECRSRPFRPTKDKRLCWKQSSALPPLKGTCRRPSRVPNGKSDMLEAVPGPPASKRTSVSVSVSVFSHQTGRTQWQVKSQDGGDWRHAGEADCPPRHRGHDRPQPPAAKWIYVLLYCCPDPSDIKGNMLETVLTASM